VDHKRNKVIREEVGVTNVDTAIKILWRIDPLQSCDSKQRPLLGNACNNRITAFPVVCAAAVSGQHLSRHVPAATNTIAIEEWCFLCGTCRDVISKGNR
jgi:hypothetical protein